MSINQYKKSEGYNYDGEPLILVTVNGTTFEFRGGQPVMDGGMQNWAIIGLGTKPGWWGNHLLEKENQIGDSDFDDVIKSTITQSMLVDAEKEARRALKSMIDTGVASRIEAIIEPQSGFGVNFIIKIYKPDSTIETLFFQKYGGRWINQATDPAYARATDGN